VPEGFSKQAVRSEGTNNSPKECKDLSLNYLELLESVSMSMIRGIVEETESMMDSNVEKPLRVSIILIALLGSSSNA
jgi:hypothetical protein